MPVKQRLLVIDGNALIHRGFHALPPLHDQRGRMVNAVYGFTTTLLKAWKELKPTHIAATFDLRGPTFRHEAYAEYKATRVKAPDELYEQFPIVKSLVEAFHIPIYEAQGFEADDVIGTIVAHTPSIETIILTGDMDTMQLVDKTTKVYTMRKGLTDTQLYDPAAVEERYGIRPDQVIDYKALRGDPSDNIPGVKGIGEKTAVELLMTFGSLEKLYTALADNSKKVQALKPAVREKLLAHKTDAFLSKKLATIRQDVPLDFDLTTAALHHFNRAEVVTLFQELNFKSLVAKLPAEVSEAKTGSVRQHDLDAPAPDRPDQHYTLVNDDQTWTSFLRAVRSVRGFVIDTETTGVDPWQAKLLGISFCWQSGEAWYVPVTEERLAALRPILADPQIEKYGHNLKYDAEILSLNGAPIAPLTFDSMLASYVLNPGTRQHGLDALAFNELGYEMMPIEALIGPKGKDQRSMEDVPLEKLSWYSCEDADFTWRLMQKLKPRLAEASHEELMTKIEMPLVRTLVDMELAGIKIDVPFLSTMATTMRRNLQGIEKDIYAAAGSEFNINSPLQLKKVLFETLQLSTLGLGKTKTGVSTSADELEKLKDAHPIVPLIMQQRELQKLLTTYIEALPELVNKKTGRVHTSFNQAVAATGRLSSSAPNLQNIPIRTDLGAEIRKAFIAEKGYRLVTADYSQIELRIVASIAKDAAMMAAFSAGEDIHTRTAAHINNVPLDQVTLTMRRAAKAVNFGIIYGLGIHGLSQSEGISRDEAREFIEKYFAVHAQIKEYIERTKQLAHDQGYVETLLGRRRYFPEINSSNHGLRAQAERMAINAPVQGTAADIMKLAMIAVHDGLHAVSPKSRLLLQVHDELVVEVPEAEVAKVSTFVRETMEHAYTLNVPIKVDVGSGMNWGEAK